MSAYAPQAIRDLFTAVQGHVPAAVLSGIVGDTAHSFGYHLCRRDLPASDYSVQLSKDKLGDAGAASALDISLNPTDMKTVTRRLHDAAVAGDKRLSALREFCGTLDGVHTFPWDLSSNTSEGLDSWDDSHLWHVHLSFYREYADDASALAPIADVIAGIPEGAPVPLTTKDLDAIAARVWALQSKSGETTASAAAWLHGARHDAAVAVAQVKASQELLAAELARIAALQASVAALTKTVESLHLAVSAGVDVPAIVAALTKSIETLTWKAA